MASVHPVDMEYETTRTEAVPITDLSEVAEVPVDLNIRDIDEALGCEELAVKLWHFDEGDDIGYHAHETQEELFYVVEGEFSVKLGRSGETETVELGEGSFWRAAPMIGRGHRCISEDGGTVLAIGAPNVHDLGVNPHDLSDEEIDEALEE
jgi:quercetin dioxygenase-like cupin family protein